MKRTDDQLKAILHENGDLVVTASAGSGKTSVMIERFLRLVVERKARVKEILAVTFTKLAAAEMKEKLATALKKKIAAKEDEKYLKGELDDLSIADISTVHSFCNTIIKRYFYIAGVDPTFSVAEEVVADEIKKEAIKEVFERLYEAEDEGLYRLLQVFFKGRGDRRLREIVLDVFEFASCEAEPEKLYEKALFYHTEEGIKTVENEVIGELLTFFEPIISDLLIEAEKCALSNETKYLSVLKEIADGYAAFRKEKSVKAALVFLTGEYKKPVKSVKDSEFSRALSDKLKSVKSIISSEAKELKKVFPDEEETRRKTFAAGETMKELIRLVKLFEEEYAAQKSERNVLDFSDLEHLTCKILKDEDARAEISSTYKYIFVDEYQDTNGAQEEIFSLLERDNLFVVGDVKQSIYAFRGSRPDIFLQRAERAKEGGLVNLGSNFRSTKNVVDAVNRVFSRVMTKDNCGVDYAAEPMVFGELYKDEEGLARIEVCEKAEKTATDLDGVYGVLKHLEKKSEKETAGRAALVRKIVEETVGDTFFDESGKMRRFSYGDIMVVSRTNDYRDVVVELARCGIPVSSEAEVGLKDYFEINMLVDILKTVATSARDDIALVSALKSGVASLSDEDLLSIRRAFFDQKFSDAVRKYSEEKSDSLAQKLKEFYSYLDRLSLFSAFEGCATLLRRIIDEKNLELSLLSMPRGEIKIKRVERFLSGLKTRSGEYTLAEFFLKKESILDKLTVADPAGEDSVKVMTMHKSKGLEAPVVIVIGMNSSLKSGGKGDVVYKNREYGFGINYYDVEKKTRESTYLRTFISKTNDRGAFAEETRLLYVALTRAKVRLFIVSESKLAAERVKTADKALRLIDLISPDDMEYNERENKDLKNGSILLRRAPVLPAPDEETVAIISKRISEKYPYKSDVSLPLKRTVTEAARQTEPEFDEEDTFPLFKAQDVEHGNAYHRFLELCSLSPDKVDEEIKKFSDDGRLTAEEAAVLDGEKLKKILGAPLFSDLSGYKLYREQPFIVNAPAYLLGEQGNTGVLLQGVIDLLAIKGKEAVIVDYKFSSSSDETLKKRYEKQLELYSFAVGKILGAASVRKILFNINLGTFIEV